MDKPRGLGTVSCAAQCGYCLSFAGRDISESYYSKLLSWVFDIQGIHHVFSLLMRLTKDFLNYWTAALYKERHSAFRSFLPASAARLGANESW